MELGLRLSPSLPTQLGPNRPAEGEWLRHTAARPLSAPCCGIQACAGAGNAAGVVRAEEDAREIPVALGSQRGIFFPHRESLRLPSDGGGGVLQFFCVIVSHYSS